jgi:hypothetical protein
MSLQPIPQVDIPFFLNQLKDDTWKFHTLEDPGPEHDAIIEEMAALWPDLIESVCEALCIDLDPNDPKKVRICGQTTVPAEVTYGLLVTTFVALFKTFKKQSQKDKTLSFEA